MGQKNLDYKNSEGFAEDVKYYGKLLTEKAFERIGNLFHNRSTNRTW